MKEIEVAARRVQESRTIDGWEPDENTPEGWVPIEVPISDEREPDGRKVLIAYPPGEGQLIAVMTTSASWAGTATQVAGAIDFLVSVLGKEDHSYVVNRLFDRLDPFGSRAVLEILSGMIEEWSGKAMPSPGGSAKSPKRTGRSSTRATPALT